MASYERQSGLDQLPGRGPRPPPAGVGLSMMDAAKGRLRAMGCPKINLQVRRSNTQAVDFYLAIGFVEDATISMGKRLENLVRK